MGEIDQTLEHFLQEIDTLRARVAELEHVGAERNQTRAWLADSESRYRSLFEDSPISLWAEDFSEVKRYLDHLRASGAADLRVYFEEHPQAVLECAGLVKIIDVNQSCLKLFKARSKEDLYGALAKLFTDESAAIFREELIAFTAGKTRFQSESPGRDLTGRLIWTDVSTSMAPGYEETWSKVFVSVIDITERKHAEEEREKLIQDLDAFAHTVAHDLKNPLGVMMNVFDLIQQDLEIVPADHVYSYLDIAARSAAKMNNIINDLLLLASVRSREMPVGPLDMQSIVSETLYHLAYLIEEYHAEIVLPEEWPVALGYTPWVEQVWVNYLSNGLKYGGTPPRLQVGATLQSDGMVRFWVCDNGPGIELDAQARLFAPFTRLDQARGGGYGLGLSIVQRIVEKLGGQVSVESAVGRGSTFSFTLAAYTK